MKVLLISAEWLFNSCSPSSQVNSRGSVPSLLSNRILTLLWVRSSSAAARFLFWGHCFLHLGVVDFGQRMFPHSHKGTEDLLSTGPARRALPPQVSPHWNMGTSRVVAARLRISEYGWGKQGWETEQAAQSYGTTPPPVPPSQPRSKPMRRAARPTPQVIPIPSLKLCSPNRTESPWVTKK